MITVGALFSSLSIQYLASPLLDVEGLPTLATLLTSEFVILLVGFFGVINIICSFVLLAKE